MGKLIVNNFITIDGFYDSEAGSLDEVFAHRWSGYTSIDDFDEYNLALLTSCDTLVLGRKAFLGSKAYWSTIDDNSNASPVRKRLAARFRTIDKVVVGSSSAPGDLDGWGPCRFVRRDESAPALKALRAGGDVLVLMSRLLWNHLLVEKLVDEVHLTVFPMALGSGRPLFDHRPTCAFRLRESRSYPDSGNVLLVYEVVYESSPD